MDYVKIQTEILKYISKNNGRCGFQRLQDSCLITTDGFVLFKIPENEMWLDCEKIIKKFSENTMFKDFLEIKGEDGLLTTDMRMNGKSVVRKVASENNHTWIDEKLLARFGIKNGLHFTVPNDKHKGVLVWEANMLCGFVMPVRVKEDE